MRRCSIKEAAETRIKWRFLCKRFFATTFYYLYMYQYSALHFLPVVFFISYQASELLKNNNKFVTKNRCTMWNMHRAFQINWKKCKMQNTFSEFSCNDRRTHIFISTSTCNKIYVCI